MSLRAFSVGLSGILGIAFVLAASAAADDQDRRDAVAKGERVPHSAEVADANSTAKAGESDGKRRMQPVQSVPTQPSQVANASKSQAWPRVTVRDLRALEGFYALDDERETFQRFLHFRGSLLEQGFPSNGYYHYGYSPSRSFVHDYIAISEYERARRLRDRHRREMEVRKVRLLTQHEKALHAGLQWLEEGETNRAIVAFTLAAKLDQADPACRIHLAQARLAQGHYLEAGLALRRALQLQPKLVYADLHLGECYKDEGALDDYTGELAEWLRDNPARPEVHFLLGFLEFQRGDFEAAHVAFERVKKVMPDDDLTRDYLEITKPPTK
jgi:tetratricopeptide (TPR) repeat protein